MWYVGVGEEAVEQGGSVPDAFQTGLDQPYERVDGVLGEDGQGSFQARPDALDGVESGEAWGGR